MKCPNCFKENSERFNFCKNCGTRLHRVLGSNPFYITLKVVTLFFIVFGTNLIFKFFSTELPSSVSIFIAVTFISTVIFLLFLNVKSLIGLLIFKDLHVRSLIISSLTFCLLGVLVHLFSETLFDFLNNTSFRINFKLNYLDSPSLSVVDIIVYVIFMPFIEEIIFRGLIFNEVKRMSSEKNTIIITAMLFSLSHVSLISNLWLFPLGISLGYCRTKYNSLMYCIFGHSIYNFTILIINNLAIKI